MLTLHQTHDTHNQFITFIPACISQMSHGKNYHKIFASLKILPNVRNGRYSSL